MTNSESERLIQGVFQSENFKDGSCIVGLRPLAGLTFFCQSVM
mgnify:CR=1 FL=1